MEIDISAEIDRFQEHLSLFGNSQIIFSGIFGIGKTYFLKKFFKDKADQYELFMLSPVNYSISQNDDIIDYIKYDIAFELLGKNVEYEKTDFPIKLTTQFYLKDNPLDVISLFVKHIDKTGKVLSEVYESLKKLITDVKKHHKESQIDEEKEIKDFLKDLNLKDHSIYEKNRITEIIADSIKNLKEQKKEAILVIDDLDRIDPEHVFRILNVFACHLDLGNSNGNKFGFDKIILVCDIENIRNLFHAKYGQKVDFSGYIDKFYSREVFYFDNKAIVRGSINKILASIIIKEDYNRIINFNKPNHPTTVLLKDILLELVNNDLMNLRTLLKFVEKEYSPDSFYFTIDPNYGEVQNSQYKITIIFHLLISFYGSIASVQKALDELVLKIPSKREHNYGWHRYNELINFIDCRNHNSKEGQYSYKNTKQDLLVSYAIKRDIRGETSLSIKRMAYLSNGKLQRTDFPFAQLLKIAFETYMEISRSKSLS